MTIESWSDVGDGIGAHQASIAALPPGLAGAGACAAERTERIDLVADPHGAERAELAGDPEELIAAARRGGLPGHVDGEPPTVEAGHQRLRDLVVGAESNRDGGLTDREGLQP